MKKLFLILLLSLPALAAGAPVGSWFQFSTGDQVFDFFFSLVVSFGLPIFVVVAIATGLLGKK